MSPPTVKPPKGALMTSVNLNKTMVNYALLTSYVDNLENDAKKFNDKEQKSCAVRARKQLLKISKLCTAMRKEINEIVKEKPVKPKKVNFDNIKPSRGSIKEPKKTAIKGNPKRSKPRQN